MPGYTSLSYKETIAEVIKGINKLDVINILNAYKVAAEAIERKNMGFYHLIVLNTETKTLTIKSYSKVKLEEANIAYANIEKK